MIFAVVLPPLGVFLERGCDSDLLINILLTILGVSFPSVKPTTDPTVSNLATKTKADRFCAAVHPRHHPRPLHHLQILALGSVPLPERCQRCSASAANGRLID
jgi:hypothetical protein